MRTELANCNALTVRFLPVTYSLDFDNFFNSVDGVDRSIIANANSIRAVRSNQLLRSCGKGVAGEGFDRSENSWYSLVARMFEVFLD